MAIDTDFRGRSALITGAASGIGAACARWLDAQGIARLVLVDRDATGLAALDLGCTVELHTGDVSDPDLWQGIEQSMGTINHAVISAGVAAGGTIAQMDYANWRRIISTNLDGAFLGLRAAMRAMGTSGGSAVVLASVAGIKPMAGAGAYGASKAALIHLARCAALEGVTAGVRVNAIAPGGVDTPIWDKERHQTARMDRMACIPGTSLLGARQPCPDTPA